MSTKFFGSCKAANMAKDRLAAILEREFEAELTQKFPDLSESRIKLAKIYYENAFRDEYSDYCGEFIFVLSMTPYDEAEKFSARKGKADGAKVALDWESELESRSPNTLSKYFEDKKAEKKKVQKEERRITDNFRNATRRYESHCATRDVLDTVDTVVVGAACVAVIAAIGYALTKD